MAGRLNLFFEALTGELIAITIIDVLCPSELYNLCTATIFLQYKLWLGTRCVLLWLIELLSLSWIYSDLALYPIKDKWLGPSLFHINNIQTRLGLVQTRTYEYVAFHNPRTTTAGKGFITIQLACTQISRLSSMTIVSALGHYAYKNNFFMKYWWPLSK